MLSLRGCHDYLRALHRFVPAIVSGAALLLALAACGDDGDTTIDPDPTGGGGTGAAGLTGGGDPCSLNGRVLLTEYNGVVQVTFQPGGTVVDHGLTTFGTGLESNVGAIGVQP